MYLFLFLCVIASTLASPDRDAIETGEKAISAYDQIITDLLSKLSFPETKSFGLFSGYYSPASADNMGNLKTTMMNSDDNWLSARQSIYELCGESITTLEGYDALYDGYTDESSAAQQDLLSEMLKSLSKKLKDGAGDLKQTSAKLSNAITKLDEMKTQFDADHKPESDFFKYFVRAAEVEASNNQSVILSIANVTLKMVKELNKVALDDPMVTKYLEEYKLPPPEVDSAIPKFILKLKAKFAEIERFYNNLKKKLGETKTHLDSVDARLNEEVTKVENAKALVEKDTTTNRNDADIRKAVKSAIIKFNVQCKTYRISNSAVVPKPKE